LYEEAAVTMAENLRGYRDLGVAWESINPGILTSRHGPFLSKIALPEDRELAGIKSISAVKEGDSFQMDHFDPSSNTVKLREVNVGAETIRRFLEFKKGRWTANFEELATLAHELEHYNFTGDFKLNLPIVTDNSIFSRFTNLPEDWVGIYGSSPSCNFIAEWFSVLAESEVGALGYEKDNTTRMVSEHSDSYLSGRELGEEELESLSDKLATLVVVSGSDSSLLSIVLRNEILEKLRNDSKVAEFEGMSGFIDDLIYDYLGFECDQAFIDRAHRILAARTDLRRIQLMLVIGKSLADVATEASKYRPLLFHDQYDPYREPGDSADHESIWIRNVDGMPVLQSLKESMDADPKKIIRN